MIKKTTTYTDYNGVERTETNYFHFTEAEIMDMQLSESGGLGQKIQAIIDSQDVPSIARIFKDLLLKAYGEKSPDGKYFLKEDENGRPLANKFKQTEAYSILYKELATDSKKASEFFNGVIPANMIKEELKQSN